MYLLGQWLNFKLFGITYLVGKIQFKLLFQGSIRQVSISYILEILELQLTSVQNFRLLNF